MLIKKADVKNHLAAKLRKHHLSQGSTIEHIPAQPPLAKDDGTIAGESSQESSKPASEFVLPVRPSGGH